MPGFWEIATLAVLALLIFGPDKLPGIARTVGRTVAQFRREAQGAFDELKRAADIEELRKVGEELKASAVAIEREAADAGALATRPPGGTIAQAPGGALAGPPPFDPEAT
jgi:sec-independent protein translocase protein TatB